MRILTVVHQPDAGPGVFAEAAVARGAQLDAWLISEQPQPPADPLGYDAVMTFGGAMHPDQDDEHPWLQPQRDLLANLLDEGTPLIGTCLGAQILTQAAGGQVRKMSKPEIGWFEVEVMPEGGEDPLIGPMAPRFQGFEWHAYECVLPAGAVVLARSGLCAQAFRVGERAWGIQFHAEVSAQNAEMWFGDWEKDEDAVNSGLDPEAVRAETARNIAAWNDLGRALCDRFLDTAAVAAA